MTVTGMSATTGKLMGEIDHIAQSVDDILGTPLGTRVKLRDYGSLLLQLADMPNNRATRLLRASAIAIALARWEPRIALRKVVWSADEASGQSTCDLTYALNSSATNDSALVRMTRPLTS